MTLVLPCFTGTLLIDAFVPPAYIDTHHTTTTNIRIRFAFVYIWEKAEMWSNKELLSVLRSGIFINDSNFYIHQNYLVVIQLHNNVLLTWSLFIQLFSEIVVWLVGHLASTFIMLSIKSSIKKSATESFGFWNVTTCTTFETCELAPFILMGSFTWANVHQTERGAIWWASHRLNGDGGVGLWNRNYPSVNAPTSVSSVGLRVKLK